MDESTIELGRLILERHRFSYQVRLDGMRPHELGSAVATMRFVGSIERRWTLAESESVSIPLLMQIGGRPAAAERRVVVTGQPIENRVPSIQPKAHAADPVTESAMGPTAETEQAHVAPHAPPAADAAQPSAQPSNQVQPTVSNEAKTHRTTTHTQATETSPGEVAFSALTSPAPEASQPATERNEHGTDTPAVIQGKESPTPASPQRTDRTPGQAGPSPSSPQSAGTPSSDLSTPGKQTEEELGVITPAMLADEPPVTTSRSTPLHDLKTAAVHDQSQSTTAHNPVKESNASAAAVAPQSPPLQVVIAVEIPASQAPPTRHLQAVSAPPVLPNVAGTSAAHPSTAQASVAPSAGSAQTSAAGSEGHTPAAQAHAGATGRDDPEQAQGVVMASELLADLPPNGMPLAMPSNVPRQQDHSRTSDVHAEAHTTPPATHEEHAHLRDRAVSKATPETASHTAAAVDLAELRAQVLRTFTRDLALEAERRGVAAWDF